MNFISKLFGKQQQVKPPKFIGKRQTPSGTYEDYKAISAESARNFLKTKEVNEAKYYITQVATDKILRTISVPIQ